MKLFALIVLSLLSTSTCFSQKFSVSELINLYENDNNFFDTYVIRKGFVFKDVEQNTVTYGLKDDLSTNNMICYNYSPDSNGKRDRSIVWVFTSENTYLDFKESLKVAGFEVYPSENLITQNGRSFDYTNHKYIITIESSHINSSLNPLYFIYVVKI